MARADSVAFHPSQRLQSFIASRTVASLALPDLPFRWDATSRRVLRRPVDGMRSELGHATWGKRGRCHIRWPLLLIAVMRPPCPVRINDRQRTLSSTTVDFTSKCRGVPIDRTYMQRTAIALASHWPSRAASDGDPFHDVGGHFLLRAVVEVRRPGVQVPQQVLDLIPCHLLLERVRGRVRTNEWQQIAPLRRPTLRCRRLTITPRFVLDLVHAA
jgi:hypothetical protein